MEDGKESGPHFSQVVAPVLAAFTLPTIALIVTLHPQPHLGNIIVALFVASTGLLLASFQFAVGRLFRDTPSWGAFRAFLAGLGLILLGAGLYLLVLSWNGETKQKAPYAGSREVLYAGLVVLAAGIVIPISINLWLYAERIFDALRRIRRGVAKRIRVLRWIYPPLDQERIEKLALGYSLNRSCPAQRVGLGRSDLAELNQRPGPMTFSNRSCSTYVNSPDTCLCTAATAANSRP